MLQWEERGATPVKCAQPSHIPAAAALFQTFEQERVKVCNVDGAAETANILMVMELVPFGQAALFHTPAFAQRMENHCQIHYLTAV